MILIFQKERDFIMSNNFNFSENDYSEIIEMALSDHIPFSAIKNIYGIEEKEVKNIMRSKLKSKSYKLWRKRVHDFGSQRENYK